METGSLNGDDLIFPLLHSPPSPEGELMETRIVTGETLLPLLLSPPSPEGELMETAI